MNHRTTGVHQAQLDHGNEDRRKDPEMADRAADKPVGLKRFMPILIWLPQYKKSWLKGDVIAGLSVWALMVPEAMAYASIAGMPPETGLYAALVAPLAYAIFGTSRQLNVGPSSTVAVLSFSIVGGLAAGSDPATFYALTAGLAVLTGVFFIVAGLAKLGFLADFMSRPVLDGFTAYDHAKVRRGCGGIPVAVFQRDDAREAVTETAHRLDPELPSSAVRESRACLLHCTEQRRRTHC